jgi:hypothetical protein
LERDFGASHAATQLRRYTDYRRSLYVMSCVMLWKARHRDLDADGIMLPQCNAADHPVGWLHNIANGKCIEGGCGLGRRIMSSTPSLHDKLRGVIRDRVAAPPSILCRVQRNARLAARGLTSGSLTVVLKVKQWHTGTFNSLLRTRIEDEIF